MTVPAAHANEVPTRLLATGDIGSTAAYHVGDEAMMLGLIESAAASGAGAEWTLMSAQPASTSQRFGVRAVPKLTFTDCAGPEEREGRLAELDAILAEPPVRWPAMAPPRWREALTAIATSDAVVIAGGGNLSRHWPEHVFERAAVVRAARRAARPVAITGQTIGPAFDPRTRELVAEILAGCVFVGVREAHSYQLAIALGAEPGRTTLQFDDAMGLEGREPSGAPAIAGDGPFIAVTLNQFDDPSDPGGTVPALAARLAELGQGTAATIVLVPHVGNLDGDPAHDVAVARAVIAAGAGSHVAPLPTPQEAVWYCRQAQMVVSTRYHPTVFATAAGTPVLFLYQDHYTMVKGQGALALVGLQDWTLPVGLAAAGLLVPAGLELWSRREAVRDHLRRLRPAIERSRRQHVAALLAALLPARWPLPSDDGLSRLADARPVIRDHGLVISDHGLVISDQGLVIGQGPSPEGEWVERAHEGLAMLDSRAEREARRQLASLEARLASMEQCVTALTTDVRRKDDDLSIAHAALEDMAGRARIAEAHWRIERHAMAGDRETMEHDRETMAHERAAMGQERAAMAHDREAIAHEREAMERHQNAMNQHLAAMKRDRQAIEAHLALVEQRAGTAEAWATVLAGEVERKDADLRVAHAALERIAGAHAAEPPDENAANTAAGTPVPGLDR